MTITTEELARIRTAAIGDMLGDPGALDKLGPAATIFRLCRELERIQNINETLSYTLRIARDRAIWHGDRLVQLGNPDVNRGQFLSVVNIALGETE